LPSTTSSSKQPLSFKFSGWNVACIFWQKLTVKLYIVTVILKMGSEIPEGRWLGHICPSVRPSVCLSLSAYTRAASTEPITVMFDIGNFFIQICPGTLISVIIGTHYRPQYNYIVDSSMKYFAAHQQCRGNPFLRFRDDTEQFCIVDSYIYVYVLVYDANGRHCCVSTPRMVTWTRHNITFHVQSL
jgi:hypothetical protein